jgi:outer membrane protein OmpA-like peptidoglycan-associated protein
MLKKILIACLALAFVFAGFAATGFYLLPKVATDKLPALLSEQTGQTVTLQAVEFNPFDVTAALHGLSISKPGGAALLSFEQLTVDISLLESLRQSELVLASLALNKPIINLERQADGQLNFSDLIKTVTAGGDSAERASEPSPPINILIHKIDLKAGQISWLDQAAGQQAKETLIPVNIVLTDFSTKPDTQARLAVNLHLESGGNFDWQGDVNLAALSSKGQIKLDGLSLNKVWLLFLQDLLPLEITEGQLSLLADYDLKSHDPAGMQLILPNATVGIKQLALNEKNNTDSLIVVPNFDVSGLKLDLQKQHIDIAKITSEHASIKAWLQADGQINYQSLFAHDQADQAAAKTDEVDTKPEQSWQIHLGELALSNYQIDFTDYTHSKPVNIQLSEFNASLKDYRNQDGLSLPLEVSTRFNKVGSMKIAGNTVLSPFSAKWSLDMQAIKLKTFQSYLDPVLNLELVDGAFNTHGQLNMLMAEPLQLTYQGNANIDNVITRDKAKNKDFVKWANLDVQQIVLDVTKQDYRLGKVIFDQPYVRFMIKKDGTTNVDDLIVVQAPAPSQPASTTIQPVKQTDEPVVTIGKIEMKQGQSDFADYSLILPFVVKMNALNGSVDGFGTNSNSAANLLLQGRVHDLATVKIKGNYQLQSGDSDITLNFSHMPLPLVTPYMAEFAGYKIEKGQMALDLAYNIQKGQLSAQNKVFIDQLVLGEKVENPKAISLPLELGIALLKDSNGKINLDFPVSGSLEDPQFSVRSLVADVLVNLITKVVTSPFKALGSLFDSDADLSVVSFAAGQSELNAEETAKLEQVAKALASKPELVLEIKGIAYEDQDWPVLRFDALTEILKKMKSGELRDKGEVIRSEYLELSEPEYQRLLTKFYAEVFPQKIDRSLLGAPRIKANPDADFYQVARQELENILQPETQRLNDLAVNRANHIAKYLVEQSGIDRSRIYILASEVNAKDSAQGIHAVLSLNVAS